MRYLFADDMMVSEADGFAQVVLRLDGPAEGTFTVNYATSNGYASYSVATDYTAMNSSVTFAPGETSKTVQIAITNNLVPESFEQFYLNLGLPAASQNLVTLTRSEIAVSIVDNESTAGGMPILSVGDVVVDESTSQYARFTVTLDRPSPTMVTVDWATAGGSAIAGSDFTADSGTVTFQPGDTAQTVEVALTNDQLAEGSEQFRLQLSAAAGATIGQATGVATIAANDAPIMPKPVLLVDDVTVSEADGYAELVLRLSAPSASAFAVNYATSNGYASYSVATDYIAQNSSVTFAPGQTVHVVKVPINTGDTTAEPFEQFYLNLGLPAASQNLVTLSRSEIVVSIVDNDSTAGGTPMVSAGDAVVDESTSPYARFAVTLDRPSPTMVTVDWTTAGGSAAAGQDYVAASGTLTFLPGQTAHTVEVALTDDQLAEGSEQFRLQLGAAAGATIGQATGVATIAANDAPIAPKPVLLVDDATVSEADGYAELALRLSAPSASPITVNYATSNGYASYSVATDYIAQNSSLTFAPGQTVHVVKVPINSGDSTPERAENFYLNLGLPAASQNLVTLSRSEIPVWIVDNDSTAGGTPIISVRDVVVDESTSQYARFAVTLDRPSLATVTVDWTTAAGSAAAGQDYVAASGTLTFLPGQTAQTVEVALTDDATPESLEQFDLRLSAAVGAIVEVGSATATIGLNDGAIAPKPVLRVDDLTVSEAGNYAQMMLRLDAPSTSTFTVNYATSNGTASYSVATDYIAQNSAVTFAPGQTVHVVQVPITNDTTPEAQEHFNLNLILPAESANRVTLARPQIPVVIVDDDSGFRVLDYGMGDDLYVVLAASDWLIEAVDGGIDTVQTALDNYTLPVNLENLTLTGGANLRGFGNALDNAMLGNPGGNALSGAAGNDTMTGGSGNDTLDGGSGTDVAAYSGNLAGYVISRAGSNYTVRDTVGADGTDTVANTEQLRFTDKTVTLVVQAKAAATPQADVDRLIELYVAFFNRVPDADGLSYWIDQKNAGQTINQIAESFYNAGVQFSNLTGFSANMTNADFVNVVYRNVLGRQDGADAGGLAYWTGELASGAASRGSLVSTMLDSAHTFKGDATYGYVADLLDNKIVVSRTFAIDWGLNFNTPEASIQQGMAIAAAITPTSIDAAIALIGIADGGISLG